MKHTLPLILVLALLFSLCACGSAGGNSLFNEASPSTSVMSFYYFDGSGGWSDWISDQSAEQAILEELSKVKAEPAEDFSADKVDFPMYGLRIGTDDGLGLLMLWTNGYLITRHGQVYKFDYDFGKTISELDWGSEWTQPPATGSRDGISHISEMPNMRYLALEKGVWNSRYMVPADSLSPPANVSMELVDWTQDTVTVNISGSREDEWVYGEYFHLEVLLDGTWYVVPPTPDENWGFTDIGIILQPGGTNSESFHLSMYGELPPGHYRLVLEGLSVEQDIE